MPVAYAAGSAHTVFFVNSCYERESGDAAGYVVKQGGDMRHPVLWFYWSEGAFMPPAKVRLTHYDPENGGIGFVVPLPDDASHTRRRWSFEGVETGLSLRGNLTGPLDGQPRQAIVLDRQSQQDALDPREHVGTGYCAPARP